LPAGSKDDPPRIEAVYKDSVMAKLEKLRLRAADSFTDKRFHFLLGCPAPLFLGLLFNHEFTNNLLLEAKIR
jgi:hypothetical protein